MTPPGIYSHLPAALPLQHHAKPLLLGSPLCPAVETPCAFPANLLPQPLKWPFPPSLHSCPCHTFSTAPHARPSCTSWAIISIWRMCMTAWYHHLATGDISMGDFAICSAYHAPATTCCLLAHCCCPCHLCTCHYIFCNHAFALPHTHA